MDAEAGGLVTSGRTKIKERPLKVAVDTSPLKREEVETKVGTILDQRIGNLAAPLIGCFLILGVFCKYWQKGSTGPDGLILALLAFILLSWPWLQTLNSKISWREGFEIKLEGKNTKTIHNGTI